MSKMKQTTHQLMEALPWKRMRNCFGAGRPCNRECVDPAEEMALYVFGRTRIDVSIPFAEKGDDCMVYVIKISIGNRCPKQILSDNEVTLEIEKKCFLFVRRGLVDGEAPLQRVRRAAHSTGP